MGTEGKKTLLLVEDDAVIALNERKQLEKYGYAVLSVNSGEKAVNAVMARSELDLVLMDIDLGKGMDGTEAAQQILKCRLIPIVFLSSHTEPEVVGKSEKITSYGYVVKNSGITVLDASIKMAFRLFEANRKTNSINSKLESMIDALPDLMFEVDLEGTYHDFHAPHNEQHLATAAERIGRKISEVLPPEAACVLMSAIAEAHEHGSSVGKQYELPVAAGRLWFEISASPIRSVQGMPHFIMLARNITERKKADMALRISEERFRMAIDEAPFPIMIHSEDGRVETVNKTWTDLTGYGLVDIPTTADWAEKAYGRRRDLDRDEIEARYGIHGRRQAGEFRVRTARGDSLIWDFGSAPLGRLSDGRRVVITMAKDTTERNRLEEELKFGEKKYHSYVDNATDGIFVADSDGRYIDVNKAASRITGYSREELLTMGIRDLSVFESEESKLAVLKQALADGAARTERRFRHKDGSVRWWTIDDIRLDDDRILAYTKDVTERKKTEDRLRENNAIMSAITGSAQDAIVLMNQEGAISFWNPAAEAMFGYRPEEALGRDLHALLAPGRYQERSAKAIEEFHRTGEGSLRMIAELEARTKDGAEISVEIALSGVRLEDGMYAVGMLRDITERKNAENRIRDLLDEKVYLLKEVHHRIKNNMTTIGSLLRLQASTLKAREAVSALEEAANRVTSMLVLYEKLYDSSNFSELKVTEYIPVLAKEIIESFPNSESVRVREDIEDFVLRVEVLQPLGIIINELVTNSMKYAFVGRSGGTISISASLDGELATLAIGDDGNGLPGGIDLENSTGFGLMLVSQLAKQLRGKIRIERGQGTKFVLEFGK